MSTKRLVVCADPIFVVGCPRSGTSVLAHSIGDHSMTWLGPESDFMLPVGHAIKDIYPMATERGYYQWLSRNEVSQDQFLASIGTGINALYTRKSEGLRWVDQTPEYTRDLPVLFSMFPEANFIHIVRDGRDVVFSMLNSGFPNDWAEDFETACNTWVEFVQAGLDFEEEHPGRVHRVIHESLISAPRDEMEQVLKFLNLQFEESTVELLMSGSRFNSSFSGGEEDRPSWKTMWSQEQMDTFTDICGESMNALSYATVEV